MSVLVSVVKVKCHPHPNRLHALWAVHVLFSHARLLSAAASMQAARVEVADMSRSEPPSPSPWSRLSVHLVCQEVVHREPRLFDFRLGGRQAINEGDC